MRSDFTCCQTWTIPVPVINQQKKVQKTRLESIWFDLPSTFLIQVWNELIDFSDFFIMFSCRDSVSSSTPPSPIHPFYSCITHELHSLNITLYSHQMMDMHDIKVQNKETTTKYIKFIHMNDNSWSRSNLVKELNCQFWDALLPNRVKMFRC